MKKIFYLSIILLLLSNIIYSQNLATKKVIITISGTIGSASLSGSIPDGKLNGGTCYQAQLDARYFFSQTLGVGLGVGYSESNAKAQLETYQKDIASVDDEGEKFDYQVKASGIKENLKLSTFDIPLFIAVRKSISNSLLFQSNIGVKFSIPLTKTYTCQQGQVETKGYYTNNEVTYEKMDNHGFFSKNPISYSGDLSTQTTTAAFADLGLIIPVGKMGISIGIYGSYGIKPVLKASSNPLITYPGVYQSVSTFGENKSLLSLGLKAGVCF